MIIKVEQRHIDAGKRGNDCDCPIAIALKEQLNTDDVWVGATTFYVDDQTYPSKKR